MPHVTVGDIVYISGQVSMADGAFVTGKLGADMDVEAGAAAARSCAISLLAQVKAACGGDLDRLVRVVKLTGFVNSTGDFGDQPKVINGASDFLVEALGDAGRHSRSAVSAASLALSVWRWRSKACSRSDRETRHDPPARIPVRPDRASCAARSGAWHPREQPHGGAAPPFARGYGIEIDVQLSADGARGSCFTITRLSG